MRDIEFRGLTRQCGKDPTHSYVPFGWVYGFLTKYNHVNDREIKKGLGQYTGITVEQTPVSPTPPEIAPGEYHQHEESIKLWEGDIVECCGERYVIVFYRGAFETRRCWNMCGIEGGRLSFLVDHSYQLNRKSRLVGSHNITVIGNIYEHPGLVGEVPK